MKNKEYVSLIKMIEYIDKAMKYTEGYTFESFCDDDKTIDEKREEIEDAIYNGNVFKHYFNEETQAKAVDILSKTSLLNDEERLIYIINFFNIIKVTLNQFL